MMSDNMYFYCANCNEICHWNTEELCPDAEQVKLIGGRFCVRCIPQEADWTGMSVMDVIARRVKCGRPIPSCHHRRCHNPEYHHAAEDGGFTDECEPFTLSPGECECREPAYYGTLPDLKCQVCEGTGYIKEIKR